MVRINAVNLTTQKDCDHLIARANAARAILPPHGFRAGDKVYSTFGQATVVTVDTLKDWLERAERAERHGNVAYVYANGDFGTNPVCDVRPL